ncbi:serine/threonine-protein phosphatase PGAM5, mitochondrial [Parasteatoda tepidariorum]|uniref:serine/threonine-protein phosphatase PGAM5, mitochondrial n=1 Tax=Parasteatoda tepidariorum TaxID=114398 RepID=UPI00077FBACC|nr:serine/threonine-protein phosphatase PGAM5, mitochondrial [Parasteatoda tepidariorum]XP_015926992.1 serine/threonine-protein phosphatase PGAM5, mitochondrial [Parasteatoda tepidariorum]
MASYSFVSKMCYGVAGCCLAGSVFYTIKQDDLAMRETSEAKNVWKWNSNWDKREPHCLMKPKKRSKQREDEKLCTLTATATRHILLIRHGQYDTKAPSDKEMKLTYLGREQAQLVGKRLKDLNISYDKLIRSTLIRAIETSDIIHKFILDVPLETSELLEEGCPIPNEPPSGSFRYEYESFQDGARIEAAFRKYFHRADPGQKSDSYEIIVCHANVIRYFVCRLLQVPPEAWLRFSLHHCSITWTTIFPNGNVAVKSYGDAGFLPADKMTRS